MVQIVLVKTHLSLMCWPLLLVSWHLSPILGAYIALILSSVLGSLLDRSSLKVCHVGCDFVPCAWGS
jgi:phosphate/sulfate permease